MLQYLKRIPTSIYLTTILLIAIVLRAYKLNFRSLWMDELFSVSDTNPAYSFSKVWNNHLFTTHPPFNYIIQWVWYKIFGYNDLQARIPPMIFGVLSVLAIFFLVRELTTKKTALIASFLLAINIYHIEYSQEARSYSLLCLMAIISFYFFVKSIQTSKPIFYCLLVITGTFLVYTHYTGIFLLVAQAIIIAGLIFISDIDTKKAAYLGGLYMVILLLCIPLIPSVVWLKKSGIGADGIPTSNMIAKYFSYYFGGQFVLVSVFVIFLIAALVHFANDTDNEPLAKSKRLTAFVLIGWIFIGLIIPYVRSIKGIPNFHIRYTIGVFPAFIVLIAIGISRIKSPSFTFITLLFILTLTSVNILFEKRYYKDSLWKADFRSLAKEILAQNKANYPIWDLGSDGFADPIEPWAFYFRQNGANPRFILYNADSSAFLKEKGVWLPEVMFSRGITEKIELLKRNRYLQKNDINQFDKCRGVLMVRD